jgi:aminoglycoside phosphotransferase (APT) family kinase protein
MTEKLSDELSIYLRGVRDELLLEANVEEIDLKNQRGQRMASAVTHLISRCDIMDSVEKQLENEIALLLTDSASMLTTLGHPPSQDLLTSGQQNASAILAQRMIDLSNLAKSSTLARPQCEILISRICSLEAKRKALQEDAMKELKNLDATKASQTISELPPLTLTELNQYLGKIFPGHNDIHAINLIRPQGVFSKEIYRFEIENLEKKSIPAILRRDRNFEIVPTSASREMDLLNHLHSLGLPVAKCLAAHYDDTPPLRRPALLMERLPGAALAHVDQSLVTHDVILQVADLLARLHQVDTHNLPLPCMGNGNSSRELFAAILDEYHQRQQRFQREAFPILEAAYAWLYANIDLINNDTTLVHGDYDLRNLLFDGKKVNAILDFELAHLGHPAEDLGYLRKDITHIIAWDEFMLAYNNAGGPKVDDKLILYFQIWAYVFHGTCNVTAFSGYRDGAHRDVFMGTLCFIEFQHIENRLIELLQDNN